MRKRADAAQAEADQLRVQLHRLVEVMNAERNGMPEKIRLAVESQVGVERGRATQLHDELERARSTVRRLEEENLKLKMAANGASATSASKGLELLDILPHGLELGSLKRSEWRHIFERLVAELVRRKKVGLKPEGKAGTFEFHTDNISSQVNELWDSAGRNRPAYQPPPPAATPYFPPPPLVLNPPARTSDAGEFLAAVGPARGNFAEADQFIAAVGAGPTGGGNTAKQFLDFTAGGGGVTNDFLAYTSPKRQSSGGAAACGLASSADFFLEFTGAGQTPPWSCQTPGKALGYIGKWVVLQTSTRPNQRKISRSYITLV